MNKKNIGVAVLDTGIYRHIDFDNRIIAFKDFINNKNIPYDDFYKAELKNNDVKVDAFSASAKEKIEALGGTAEVM